MQKISRQNSARSCRNLDWGIPCEWSSSAHRSVRRPYSGYSGGKIDSQARDAEEQSAQRTFAPRCVSIDLEIGRDSGRIHSFAAVRGDTGQAYIYRGGDLAKSLLGLDEF